MDCFWWVGFACFVRLAPWLETAPSLPTARAPVAFALSPPAAAKKEKEKAEDKAKKEAKEKEEKEKADAKAKADGKAEDKDGKK